MRTRNDKIDGDYRETGELDFQGMVTGTLTVAPGAKLKLRGIVSGNLVVETGAEAVVHGKVLGDVINQGGTVRILGTVEGALQRLGGTTSVDPAAVVRR